MGKFLNKVSLLIGGILFVGGFAFVYLGREINFQLRSQEILDLLEEAQSELVNHEISFDLLNEKYKIAFSEAEFIQFRATVPYGLDYDECLESIGQENNGSNTNWQSVLKFNKAVATLEYRKDGRVVYSLRIYFTLTNPLTIDKVIKY